MYSRIADRSLTNLSEQLQDFNLRVGSHIQQHTFELEVLYKLTQHIGYTLNYDELFRLLLTHLHCAMPYDVVASLLMTDQQAYELLIRPMRPLVQTVQELITTRLLETLAVLGDTCTRESVQITYLEPDQADGNTPPVTHLHSMFIFPLIVDRKTVGLFLVGAEAPAAYNEDDVGLVYRVANQAANSIQRLRALLDAEQQRLEQLVESIPDGVVLLNAQQHIVLFNPSGRTYLGLLTEASRGDKLTHLADQSLELLLTVPPEPGLSHELVIDSPAWRVFEVTARAVEHGPEAGGWALIIRDTTEQKRAAQRIQHMALYDALTDLPNRTLFHDRLLYGIAQSGRTGRVLAVMFLDLDRFKAINDSLGHGFGDCLLQMVAQRLRGCVRQSDTVARLGGDEFTVILANLQNGEDAALVAQNILTALGQPFQIEGREIYTSASIGIAVYPTDADDSENLIKHADAAMYRAKEHGRNAYAFYTRDMHQYAVERLVLEHELRRAFDRAEFVLHYQPQVDLRSGALLGLESLVRWQHPTMGLLYPGQFLWVAEETGLMPMLGVLVLRMACVQNHTWQQCGLRGIRMAVNVAANHLVRANIVHEVSQVLGETGLAPRYLELELTEGGIMRDAEGAIAILRKLKALGIRLAVDDFGTGYSSLSYLKRFPINTLKIDKSFVRDVPLDTDSGAIVTTIIAMAHNLKLDVIAEGVETADQATFLAQHGCNVIQGYFHSAAMAATDVEPYLVQPGRDGSNNNHT